MFHGWLKSLTKWLVELVSPLPHTSLIATTTLQISRESIEVKIKSSINGI
jgi:hypothetical protein